MRHWESRRQRIIDDLKTRLRDAVGLAVEAGLSERDALYEAIGVADEWRAAEEDLEAEEGDE